MKENTIYLTDVNAYITCVLCKGYLIDATTITECLHTFCKKCIVEFLEENTNCPICDTLLHQSHPLLYISHDRTLQAIVYKLVPNLEKNELEKQIKFYKERNQELPQQLKEKLDGKYSYLIKNDDDDGKKENTKQDQQQQSQQQYYANIDPTFHRNDDQLAICLEPVEGLDNLERKYLLCSCNLTITHLKKLISKKIFQDIDKYKDLDIICNDEILGKDHTLRFIFVTKWKDKELPIKLNFRPKLVF